MEPIAAHRNVSDGSFAVCSSIDFATLPSVCSSRVVYAIVINPPAALPLLLSLRPFPIHHARHLARRGRRVWNQERRLG